VVRLRNQSKFTIRVSRQEHRRSGLPLTARKRPQVRRVDSGWLGWLGALCPLSFRVRATDHGGSEGQMSGFCIVGKRRSLELRSRSLPQVLNSGARSFAHNVDDEVLLRRRKYNLPLDSHLALRLRPRCEMGWSTRSSTGGDL